MQDTNVELLTVEDIMKHLKISRTKAYELVKKSIPKIKIGKSIRIMLKDYNQWLQNQKVLNNSSKELSVEEEIIWIKEEEEV